MAWVLGTAVQLFQPSLWTVTAYGQLCLLACLGLVVWIGLRRHSQCLCMTLLTLCAVAVLAFATVGWRASYFAQQALPDSLEGVDLVVTGVIANMPQVHADGVRFQFEVERAQQRSDGQVLDVPQDIQLAWYAVSWDGERKALPELRAGERWTFHTRLKQPHGLVNPGGFDAELWFWEQGIHATGHVRDGAHDLAPVRLASTWQHLVEQGRQALRHRVMQTVSEARWSGLIAGLLIGDQAAIDHSDWDLFRITGIAHLMSISGLHITLWAWLARRLIERLWRHSDVWGQSWCLLCPAPVAGLWGGVLCAAAYAVFSGWGVPAQRTVAMLAMACVLRTQALRWPLHTQWLMAAVWVLIIDPWALMQAGFWLSFVAVGVLFLSTPIAVTASKANQATVMASAAKQTKQLLREQLLISLCLAPLSFLLFQQISVVGLLVNLFAIPWVTLVVTPLAFLGSLCAPLWLVCSWSLQALCAVLEPVSQLPWAVWHMAAPPWWVGACGVVGGGVLAGSAHGRWRMAGLCLLLPCLLWPVPRPAPDHVELIAADIGQGNAVLVRTATHSLLFDTGPRYGSDNDAGQRVLLPLLQTTNERLDTLVLSHQDSDHTGGAISVQRMQGQAQVLTSITNGHWLSQKLNTTRCEAGQHWQWDGVVFDMLHPLASDYTQTFSPNARSCVLRISAAGQVVLLTADIEAFQEQALLQRTPALLRADVLLVPHHGSKTSSTEAFIEAVQPRWAMFQMGYRNRYGHPAPQVLQRYVERGIALRLSPSCGAMTWRSADPALVHCMREESPRYWRHRLVDGRF